MTVGRRRLQEAMQQVRLGMDEVAEERDRCLQEMKEAISPLDITHMSKTSEDLEDVSIIIQNNNKTKEILQEYEEAHQQMLRFIEVKHAIRKALELK